MPRIIPISIKFLTVLMFVVFVGITTSLFAQTPDSTVYQIELIDEVEVTTAYADLYFEDVNRIDSIVVFHLNEGEFIEEYKEHHYRDELFWNTYEFLNRSFDDSGVQWDSLAKQNRIYDLNRNNISDIDYRYDFENLYWFGVSKKMNEYSEEGLQLSSIEYVWDSLTFEWLPTQGWKIRNFYESGSGFKDTITVKSRIISGNLTLTDSIFSRYDLADRLIEHAEMTMDTDAESATFNQWINVSLVKHVFGVSSHIEELYLGEGQQWNKLKRSETNYQGEDIVEYREESGVQMGYYNEWFEVIYNTYTYPNDRTLESRYFAFDASIEQMRGVKKVIEEFDSQGRIIFLEKYGRQEEFYGVSQDNSWKSMEKFEYAYRSEVITPELTNYYYEVLEYEVYYETGKFREKKRTEYLMSESQKVEGQDNELIKLEVKEYKGDVLIDQGIDGWLVLADKSI